MALLTVVFVNEPLTLLIKVPESKVPDTPASFASLQPSPSESKSNRFGIPSLSISGLQVAAKLSEKSVPRSKALNT